MADEKIEMSIAAMSRTMSNAVLRERRRCAKLVEDAANIALSEGYTTGHRILLELHESILTPPGVQIVPTASLPTVGEAAPVEAEPVDDLPPVRHNDDFDDGVALARNQMARRADFAHGGGIGRD